MWVFRMFFRVERVRLPGAGMRAGYARLPVSHVPGLPPGREGDWDVGDRAFHEFLECVGYEYLIRAMITGSQ